MIRNRKNLIMDRDCEDLIRVERGTSDRGEKKKKEHKVSVKVSRLRRTILRNSNPDFGPERGQGTRSAPCSKRCCVRPLSNTARSSFFLPELSRSFSLRLSSGLVREPSHSQKTQNADGHVNRRHQSAARKGPKNEGEEGKRVCVRTCVLWRQAVHRLIFLPLLVALCKRTDAEISLFRHRLFTNRVQRLNDKKKMKLNSREK